MPDRRLWRANAHVAHSSLEGQVAGVPLTDGTRHQITKPVANLLTAGNGKLDRQLLFGEAFQVLHTNNGFAFGFEPDTGFVGYIKETSLGSFVTPTHRIKTLGAQIYPSPDIKTTPIGWLPFAALVNGETSGDFFQLPDGGFLHQRHITPIATYETDPITTAERLLDVPYLWGGDSNLGLDCSGLVHLSHKICGQISPRDSDQQEASFGTELPNDTSLQRGDIVFWKGHVGLMQDADTLIHANGYHMAVASEPLETAVARIAKMGGGPITCRRRVKTA